MPNLLLGFSPIFPTPLDARELGWGLLLGKDEGFSQEIKTQTKAAGVTHLTAASGANISLFQSLLWPVEGWFWLHASLELFMIALYWNLSGASGSLWRASLLALFSLGAKALGRPASFPWLLCLVAFLALSSEWRESLGFWLSWLAVGGVYISQSLLSGEKKNVLSPHLWGFCKWVASTLLSGSIIMVFVSIILFRVFGEWQPQGLIGTIVSSPFVPIYITVFVLRFLFQEGNKVALQFLPGTSSITSTLLSVSGAVLQVLLGALFLLWGWVRDLPVILSILLIVVSCGGALFLVTVRARKYHAQRRAARQWGWVL